MEEKKCGKCHKPSRKDTREGSELCWCPVEDGDIGDEKSEVCGRCGGIGEIPSDMTLVGNQRYDPCPSCREKPEGEGWAEKFDREFGINRPPVLVRNPLIEAERVKDFIHSLLKSERLSSLEALERGLGEKEEIGEYTQQVAEGWNECRKSALELMRRRV